MMLHRVESDLKCVFITAVYAEKLDPRQVKQISHILADIIRSEHHHSST